MLLRECVHERSTIRSKHLMIYLTRARVLTPDRAKFLETHRNLVDGDFTGRVVKLGLDGTGYALLVLILRRDRQLAWGRVLDLERPLKAVVIREDAWFVR